MALGLVVVEAVVLVWSFRTIRLSLPAANSYLHACIRSITIRVFGDAWPSVPRRTAFTPSLYTSIRRGEDAITVLGRSTSTRAGFSIVLKRGFTFPMARWMKTCAPELREIAESGANQRSMGRNAVRECWTGFSEGKVHWSRAWALTVLGSAN